MVETKTYKPIPELNEKDYIRFWSKAELTANPDKCWNRELGKCVHGYGRICLRGVVHKSHRVAYYLHYNVDPKELFVLHKCDNPICVNPYHLFLGTTMDNMKDKMKKGRGTIHKGWTTKGGEVKVGSGTPKAKLKEEQVVEIRRLYDNGDVTQATLSLKFKISTGVISYILNNKIWKHI